MQNKMKLTPINKQEAIDNMLTNAENSIVIYQAQIDFYEYTAEKQEDEKDRAIWLVERDKIKKQQSNMEETFSLMKNWRNTL